MACRTVYFDAGSGVMVPFKSCEKLMDYCQHKIEKIVKKMGSSDEKPPYSFTWVFCFYLLKNHPKSINGFNLDLVRM